MAKLLIAVVSLLLLVSIVLQYCLTGPVLTRVVFILLDGLSLVPSLPSIGAGTGTGTDTGTDTGAGAGAGADADSIYTITPLVLDQGL